ncbi:MAG TPA: ABC transporter transmembrane domain-containing protein, partial [Stellaceae bacterium]
MATNERGDSAPTGMTQPRSQAPPRRLKPLLRLLGFLRPYRLRIVGAGIALVISSSMVLLLGQGVRHIVDEGLRAANAGLLDRTVGALMAIIAVLALSTYGRFYLVSWIGERVIADLRVAAFDRIVSLSPAYFETTKTGEV